MEKVQVRDKVFEVSIPEARIKERVAEVAAKIDADMAGRKPLFLAVLNGSFVFAADLLRGVTTPCEITFVRMSSYAGTASTGSVRELIGLSEDIAGRDVVIVEDIIDSGLTMVTLLETLRAKNPASVSIAALLVKPGNLKADLSIPYCCFEIPNDFIVGYGLDYDGEGRNLPSIYTVVE